MNKLKQDLSLADVVALGLSAAIGVSIFSVVSPATLVAGPAMLLALGLAAIPMMIFAIVYSFMTTAVPKSGASFEWPTMFVHPLLGFTVAWLRIIGCAGGFLIMATVFASYLERLVEVPRLPVMIGILTFAYLVNIMGGGTLGRVAQVLVVLKLVVLFAFIAFGFPHIEVHNFHPFAPFGTLSVVAAVPLLVGLYTGIESAAEGGEEIRDGRRIIAKGLIISASIGLVIYFGTSLVTIGVLGAGGTATSDAPISDAGHIFLGVWSAPMIDVAALLAIAAATNALMFVYARFVFAMGRDGVLPASLGRLNGRWGTPHIAITLAYVSALFSLLLPQDLLFLFLAANLPTMLKYASNCLASARLLRFRPDLHEQSGFGIGRSPMLLWSWAGVICGVAMMVVGATADWRPYALLAGWAAIGVVYWAVIGRKHSSAMASRSQPL